MGSRVADEGRYEEATSSSSHRATSLVVDGAAPKPPPVRRLGQVPGLDGMRGVAVIIVFVAHLNVILPIPRLLVIPGGTVSLDSFFVLSGFLITALLLREQARKGRVDKFAFYRRRALRLLPALLAMLIAYAIYAYVAGITDHEEWTSLLSVGLYYSNWKMALGSTALGGHFTPGLQHLWSLSMEEQFYLLWPWVTILLLSFRQRLRTVIIVLVSLIVAVAVHRALAYHGLGTWYAVFVRTDTRADAILIGCLLAHVWMRGRDPWRGIRLIAWVAAGFLLVCLPLVEVSGPFLYRGGFVAIDIACAILVLAIVNGRWAGRRFFELRPFIVLGTVSYALYLWHLPVFFAVQHYGDHWNNVVKVLVATTVTLGFTALSWFLLERPALRWKDRLEAPRTRPEAGSGGMLARRPATETIRERAVTEGAVSGGAALVDPNAGAT